MSHAAHSPLVLLHTCKLTLQNCMGSPPRKREKNNLVTFTNQRKKTKTILNVKKQIRVYHCVTTLTWMLLLRWGGAGRGVGSPHSRLSSHGHSYLKHTQKNKAWSTDVKMDMTVWDIHLKYSFTLVDKNQKQICRKHSKWKGDISWNIK